MDSIFINEEFNPKFPVQDFPNPKNPKIIRKNTISFNKFKTPRLHSNLQNDLFRTGDRFIPLKNDKDNFQNFLLHTPIPISNNFSSNTNNNALNSNINANINNNNNRNNGNNEQDLLSPLEEKPEKNYANFIVDNMLRINSDNYNYNTQKDKMGKFRSNSIFTFSKKVSFSSINFSNNTNSNILRKNTNEENYTNKLRNSSNNKTCQKKKESNSIFDNIKIDTNIPDKEKAINKNNIILLKSDKINNSNELPKSKAKNKSENNINNNNNNKNHIINNNISSLLYEPDHLSMNINNIFNENNSDDISRNDLIFQYIDNTNKRNILPDTDYLLANYSTNQSFKRKINPTPERILDAPNLVDDYYLNLLEWGTSDILAVALGPEIYLWNSETSETSLLMSIIKEENQNESNSLLNNNNNVITSLSWMNNGVGMGIGLPNGILEIWDVNKSTKIREIEAHSERISSLAWNGYIVTTGSKDKLIKNFDVRCQDSEISKIRQHKQEVCALRYSPEGDLLASGGNDNTAYIWDVRKLNNKLLNISNLNEINNCIKPLFVNNYHTAAVKALSWCPWQRHVLATGGGSKDRTLKIFNCDSNKIIKNVDTGSQVCAVLWNKKEREIISSHGFNKNQITIWNYQKMKKICELKGHMSRVLYLTISPDENYICSGSGDETLRFWKINDGIQEAQNEEDALLSNVIIR